MKFITTTSEKVSTIPIVSGQMIFSRDNRVIYLDANQERISYEAIITVLDEATRLNLISPVYGFYFVEETSMLWRYANEKWTPITVKVDDKIIFADTTSGIPEKGKDKTLYVDSETNQIYRWDENQQKYIVLNSIYWTEIQK